MLDLVVLQACQSEIVGGVFQENCAKHVICINQNRNVRDQASVTFTENLYKNLFGGESICVAFHKAIAEAQLVLGCGQAHEAEIEKVFKLLLFEDHPSRPSKKKHQCCHVVIPECPPKGQSMCVSDHVQFKNLPDFDPIQIKYRPKERQAVVKALCSRERLIALHGLYGVGQEQIARSCLEILADRKVFPGGIIFLDLKSTTLCSSFFQKLSHLLSNRLPWRNNNEVEFLSNENFTNELVAFFNKERGQ